MKYKKITAEFEAENIILAEELICDIFFAHGLKGVICSIPLDEPDEGFGTNNLPDPVKNAIIGYLPDTADSDHTIEQIRSRTQALLPQKIRVSFSIALADEESWAHAWKAHFHVTPITDTLIVKPSWEDYTPLPGQIVLQLDPGMAFGTGTHPTTAMCLEMIQAHLLPGGRFLDVGCGSGILMAAAAKLGAKVLSGIDTDPVAIEVSRQNLQLNGILDKDAPLFSGTLDETPQASWDLIAANIIATVIVDILPRIAARLADNGKAILSGIIADQKPDLVAAIAGSNLRLIQEKRTDEWLCLVVAPADSPMETTTP